MRYVRVESLSDAFKAMAEPGSLPIAGGTDLLVKMRGGLLAPKELIDISNVSELRGIRLSDTHIEIGAAVTEEEIRRHPAIVGDAPLLADVLGELGSVQIRNRGTLGGNLVNASPAADSAIPLLLYGAEVRVASQTGSRPISLSELFVGPGKTSLQPGELVVSIRLPRTGEIWFPFFHKVGKRRALTISIASVGSLLRVESGRIAEARFAAGSVAPTPLRLTHVEHLLKGAELNDRTILDAAAAAAANVSPISDVRATGEYRRLVVAELVERALRSASG